MFYCELKKSKIRIISLSIFLLFFGGVLFLQSNSIENDKHTPSSIQRNDTAITSSQNHPPGEEEGQGEHEGGSGVFLGKVINFILLFGGLTFILRKPVSKFLKERGEGIEQDLEKAKSSKILSKKNLNEIKSRLGKIANEASDIKINAGKEGKADKARILKETITEAEHIKEITRQNIQLLGQFGIQAIRSDIGELAISIARKRIQEKISPEEHVSLLDKSIKRLKGLHAKSDSA